ncbi:CMGC protein kinase, variant [Phytophthora nicotianae INRA-310]|uniref:CMGC protein kinase, variant n=6 Tax=Phytophthora nicotianae TaxID=4792 RepID=W2QRX2_PHYN3|nr:CMGC protein kinase, variant [Phytophthora nicotianae INRA-310]ETN15244.1 CMGC protein kinase, variant [Phytophthora nicotianae INRA-310]
MRVKKLNVNRRHKPGEDEAVAAGGDSEQRKWVSPTKPQRGAEVSTGSNSGSSSPTDVQQQQHLDEHSPLVFQPHNNSDLYARGGAGGVSVMPNTAADEAADKSPMRKAMIDRIVETLRAMKPHAPEKVLAALPRLALHMEKALFKLAKNEAEYCDQSTLRLRITHIQENNAKRLLAQQQQQQTPEQSGNTTVPPLKPLTEEQARVVFQCLQSWRQKLVNMYGVAPWDILPNATLAKVALYMPSTEQELSVCGVGNEQIARFGSSLVQELQRLRGPAPSKPAARPIKAKPGRKAGSGKRGSSDSSASSANKKRKNGEAARLAPAAPSFSGTSLMAPAPLLPAVDSLPTLLPTVSMIPGGVTASASATSSRSMRESPSSTPTLSVPEVAMGAGQLSKQQNVKSLQAYEQEVQSLRWMLHQSQQEKSQLEMEVQRLRAQLQSANGNLAANKLFKKMQTLVEGQTLLHDGRYRFLRRIGSGTFAVIMRALDIQQQRHVAIKCVRQQELNALGEREAAALRRVNNQDADAACAETFEEQGHFCLVLELLGPPVLDVGRWGPWRQAPGAARVPDWTQQLFKRKRRRSSDPTNIQSPEAQKKLEAAILTPSLSLVDVRQMAVHLCGALAFIHDQGLIHADVKPENVVRSNAEASMGSSPSQSPCSSPVKLVDFGNCLDASELAAYAEEKTSGGFDVQTVTYRAPEVAAGLLLCPAMDMWSLGCLLLECVSGKPLFTLPALDASVQERSEVARLENNDLLRQIEGVITNGVSLSAACAPYRSAARYEETTESHRQQTPSTSLKARLEAAALGNHQFQDFIYSLLNVNPATRITAKQALFHPFLQAFFPFKTVFAHMSSNEVDRERERVGITPSPDTKRTLKRSRAREVETESRARKKKSAERAASARTKDLRQVLKIIPRDVAGHSSLSPR